MSRLYADRELDELIVRAVFEKKIRSIVHGLDENGYLAHYLITDDDQYEYRSLPELKEKLRDLGVRSASQQAYLSLNGTDAEKDDEYLLDALRLTIDDYGTYREIYLSNLVRDLRQIATAEGIKPQEIIAQFERERIGVVEKRPGEPYDYSVLILNEDHEDVQRLRETLNVYRKPSHRTHT